MENCVAPGLDEFDVLLEVVLSLVRVGYELTRVRVDQLPRKLVRHSGVQVCIATTAKV